MKLGAMRDHVLIQKKTSVSDGQGGFTVTWQDHGEYPTRVSTVSLRERARFNQFQLDVTHEFIVRTDIDNEIDENMRLLLITNDESSPQYFDIVSVEDFKERGRFSKIIARTHRVKLSRKQND